MGFLLMDKTLKQNSSLLVHTKCPYGAVYEDIKVTSKYKIPILYSDLKLD